MRSPCALCLMGVGLGLVHAGAVAASPPSLLRWAFGSIFHFGPSVVPPLGSEARPPFWRAQPTARETLLTHWVARWYAYETPFHMMPPYPYGYVIVTDHQP